MSLAGLFSLLYFHASSVYAIFGVHALMLHPRSAINRVYFVLCLFLSVWAGGFAFANSAPDPATSILWRRVSAVGWSLLYAILLHFILVLTRPPLMRRFRLLPVLIYLPAMANLYLFAVHGGPQSTLYRYDVAREPLGWVNNTVSPLDWVFNVYFLSFNLLSILLLLRWGFRSKDPSKRHLVRLLFGAFTISLLLGTVTDLVVNYYTPYRIPQMAAVLTILPVLATYYPIGHYGLMKSPERRRTDRVRQTGTMRQNRFYWTVSLLFLMASSLQFAARHFLFGQPASSTASFSLTMAGLGIFLFIIPLFNRSRSVQDVLFILLMMVTTPMLGYLYLRDGNLSVWLFPFVLPLLSVLIGRRWMLWGIVLSMLGTQLMLWFKAPAVVLQLEGWGRLMLLMGYAVLFLLSGYVNKVYIGRLRDNEEQLRFQHIVSELSADFAGAGTDEMALESSIRHLLALCGQQVGVDRMILGLHREAMKTYAWQRSGGTLEAGPSLDDAASLSWFRGHLDRQEVLTIPDAEALPQEAERERLWMREHRLRAMLVAPLRPMEGISGFLVLISDQTPRNWRAEHADLLTIVGNLLADALQKLRANREIHALAHEDGLTGLPNQQSILQRVESQIRGIPRGERGPSVLLMDLDGFKSINDMMGHAGGDDVLRTVADRLKGCLGWQDELSRTGGDEFLMLLSDPEQDLPEAAKNVMEAFAHPISLRGREFFVTASIGIATYPEDGESADILVRNAEMAMYAAKASGKNQYSLCSVALRQEVQRQSVLTNDLYQALQRNQLQVAYQPQIEAATGRVTGFEALLRWYHPDLGQVSPAVFIPIAEKTGLIHRIGHWVLRQACRQCREWQTEGLPPVRIAVNLSLEQFRDPNLVGVVGGVLEETGLDPEWLELEITESVTSEEVNRVVEILRAFKQMGVQMAIDDFGTEYSSLSRLKTLPVDRLKLDMMFVHGIGRDKRDEAVAATIMRLARDLNLHTIAEGVETLAQEKYLLSLGCEEIQGFLHYRPLPAKEARTLLVGQRIFDMHPLPHG